MSINGVGGYSYFGAKPKPVAKPAEEEPARKNESTSGDSGKFGLNLTKDAYDKFNPLVNAVKQNILDKQG